MGKVTDFTALTSSQGTDTLYLIRNNSDYKITLATLLANLPNTLAKFGGLIALNFANAQVIANSGTVTASKTLTLISNTAPSTLTLEDGTQEGQIKVIMCTVATSTTTVNVNINTPLTFRKRGDAVILSWFDNDWWVIGDSTEVQPGQINSDWNATTGVARILNKPTIPVDISNLTDTTNLLNKKVVDYLDVTSRISSSGNLFSFIRPPNTNVADNVDTGLSISRKGGAGEGIYNSALESGWDPLQSPVGTLWNWDGWDNLDNVKNRKYGTLSTTLQNKVDENILNAELVMFHVAQNKYYKVKFSTWQTGPSFNGTFAYIREFINVTDNVGISFPDGSTQVSAVNNIVELPQVKINDGAHTLRMIDRGCHIYGYNTTVKIPTHAEVAFPMGTQITVISSTDDIFFQPTTAGTGIVQIFAIGPSMGYHSINWAIAARSFATLTKIEQNVWYLTGTGIFED